VQKLLGAKYMSKLPIHVAIVMDGNGRWALKRGLKRIEGHKKGSIVLREIVKNANKMGIRYLSLFAFSTENWNRSLQEVKFLMNYSRTELALMRNEFDKQNIKIVWSGTKKRLYKSTMKELELASTQTKNNTDMVLNICINYGGKQEIIDCVNKALKQNRKKINTKQFDKLLYQPTIPPVDLFIRTSGEKRISNFLLWESAYAEFMFTNTLWPDFNSVEFVQILNEYKNRDRRFGS
jgi:undecaprenyl diphosphate synthase